MSWWKGEPPIVFNAFGVEIRALSIFKVMNAAGANEQLDVKLKFIPCVTPLIGLAQ